MAILPGGTANALADDVGIPLQLAAAAQLVCSDSVKVRAIDVGLTGEHHFLLRVGTGMVARFSEGVTREMKDRFGIAAYIIGGIAALTNPLFVDYKLTIDGQTIETQGAACLITNGNAIGALGIRLSKHVFLDDGLLDVFILNSDIQTVLGMAGSIAQIDNLAVSLQHWQGREIVLEANPPQGIYGDGEETPFAKTPSTTRVLPGALKVVVPASENRQ
jgi:diacylglycerol kinase family enzyme